MEENIQNYDNPRLVNGGILCFGILSYLTAKSMGLDIGIVILGTVIGIIYLWIGLMFLGRIMAVLNKNIAAKYGKKAVNTCVGRGYLTLIPFTVLACFAELYFHWNSSQVFASAGLMAAGSMSGAELIKAGGGKISSLVLPALFSAALSGLWMYLLVFIKGMGV